MPLISVFLCVREREREKSKTRAFNKKICVLSLIASFLSPTTFLVNFLQNNLFKNRTKRDLTGSRLTPSHSIVRCERNYHRRLPFLFVLVVVCTIDFDLLV